MTRNVPEWLLRSPTFMRAAGIHVPKKPKRVSKPKPLPAPAPVPKRLLVHKQTWRDKLDYAITRRAKLRAAKRCINGWSHGKATHGCRCKRCYLVHGGDKREQRRPSTKVVRDDC